MKEELDNGKGFDELFVRGFSIENDLDKEKVRKFLQRAGMDSNLIEEEALWKVGVAKAFDDGLKMNNAAVLFFAKEPQKFIEQSSITCVRYKGVDKFNYMDRVDLSDDLWGMVDSAEAFVRKNTRIASKFVGFDRIDKEEYPYTAIREAVINALCHRNYYFDTTNVFVNIYDDRIEVFSPGGIPHGLSLKEVMNKSFPRNKQLLKLFKEIGEVEKLGSGLNKMKKLMKEHGLKEPVFEVGKASFQVTFYGPGDKILDLIKDSRVTDLREVGLNERQVRLLNFLSKERKKISSREYREMFNVGKNTTNLDLTKLIELKFIQSEGRGKATHYFLK